ncbi:MAG: hypothetical protein QHJ73_06465, partial [Armatimonadota bacterium]|nr:hypothetical protein [Armatimonadota bacterium]
LMRTAYENAKATDPTITILGVNTTTGGGGAQNFGGAEWTRGVVAAGGLDYCDVVCYHNYISGKPGYPGDVCEKGFQVATGPIVERFGRLPKPVWMTEGSAGRDTIGPGFYRHTLPYPNTEDPMDTGDRLCRYVVSLLAQGVQKVFLYSMHSHSSLLAASEWRVLVTPEGMLHPSGAAHAAMAWQLEDTRFVKQWQVAEGVTAYLFEGEGRAVVAVSALPNARPYVPPARPGLRVTDLFGNPVPNGQPVGHTLAYVSMAGSAAALEKALQP